MKAWIIGARPRTLPAAFVPVMVGTAVASHVGDAVWDRALLALIVSLALQIGVNYANDYSDGVRGTDRVRVGPLRLVASGTKPAAAVKRAAWFSFVVALVAGTLLALLTSPWMFAVGAVSVAAAWYYTGGQNPYGYRGFGELSVFVFFGLVAVTGTAFVQLERFTWLSFVAAIPIGLLAVALLLVNNLRDRPQDAEAGKKTLSVRIGDVRTRQLYLFAVGVPFIVAFFVAAHEPFVFIVVIGLVALISPVRLVVSGAVGQELITVLKQTGQLQLIFGFLFSLGLVLGA